ncbi:MAG TPA: stalk domain-containing protein [Paenibacillus sp.]|uniref:stalk domain-containing protein n=1 Tax=Paenibacillus sp. TaxID=58172 RepID=UPI002B6F4B91|nr:stalk domain-containing protein [Paenibacillus sp.]HUC92241.1 stalk domain-containing protein [Paenibacillus sp.]
MKTSVTNKIAALLAAAIIAVPAQAASAAPAEAAAQTPAKQPGIRVYVDGKQLAFKPAPVERNGTILVPMRPIFDALEAPVAWQQQTKTVFARKGSRTIALKLGSKQAVVSGKAVKLSAPPQVIGGATMVPLRFVSEALDADTVWESTTKSVRIASVEYRLEQEIERLGSGQAVKKKLSAAEIVARVDDYVGMITTDYGQGSGIVLSDRWLLTNYHVINGAKEGQVQLGNGVSVPIQGVVEGDPEQDLAILQTKEPMPGFEDGGGVAFGDGYSVRKGDRVYAIGSPLGIRNTVSEGLISNITFEGGARVFQTNAQIDHGSSGGGLFNEYGELIGITTSGVEDTKADLNFAVAVSGIEGWLQDLRENPVEAGKIRFPESALPDSLKDAADEDIRKLMEDNYGELQTSQGSATFDKWAVTRDAKGWIVISAVIDPAFYMLYGDKASNELREWALNIGSELRRMLPDERIQFLVSYEQTFNDEPRGFADGETTDLGGGKWRLRYDVIDLQILDRMHIRVRS